MLVLLAACNCENLKLQDAVLAEPVCSKLMGRAVHGYIPDKGTKTVDAALRALENTQDEIR
eukprot:CAMPEP_0179086056 /NCGR_PEP_ID=MMETSP0796-20121207/39011_1 /TAXON_ID=73915 /ORGANISM="Pyrodinium bahamense, Strain pbaha01" /LENGTH=60 /DNA_ID=CAMNT_0020783511 /DNA_START=15 /DNA_END=194 /DNA_ORIENTATION=+